MLCPPLAHAVDAHALITHCAATAAPGLRGLAAIRKACPGVGEAVATLGMSSMLPAGWDKSASPATLSDLDALAARYAGHPSSALPAASDLRKIALRLRPLAPASSLSFWDHIEAWLRARLAPFGDLLKKWLHSLPDGDVAAGMRGTLLVVAAVLIVLSLVALILWELRAAGFFDPDRRRRSATRRRATNTRVAAVGATVGDDLVEAHALDRPAAALRLLIEALRHSRRIERDGNLTCREVVARAVFDTQGQREEFAGIAKLAERELFGPRGSSVQVPDELRSALQALYHELLAAPAMRSAVS